MSATINRKKTTVYCVDGVPLLVPDNDVDGSFEDLDNEESGRTLDGVMHRSVARFAVATWSFEYHKMTASDYAYMQALFKGKPEFQFTYPGDDGKPVNITAYRSKYGIALRNAKTGDRTNYKFNIIEC